MNNKFRREFILGQARLNDKLQRLNRSMAMREAMKKVTVNNSQFAAMKERYEKEIISFEILIF